VFVRSRVNERRPQTARRVRGAVLVAVDQGIYSFSTLVVTVIAARELPVAAFGAFSLGVAAVTLGAGLARSTLFEPVLILSGVPGREQQVLGRLRWCSIWAGLTGLAIGFAVAGVATCAGTATLPGAIGLGVFLAGPLLQDGLRMCLVALARRVVLVLLDAMILFCQTVALLLYGLYGQPNFEGALMLWGGTSLLFALAGYASLGRLPGESRPRSVLTREGRAFGADYLLGVSTSQIVLWTASLTTGAPAAAALRGADACVGPLRVLLLAASPILLRALGRVIDTGASIHRAALRPLVVGLTLGAVWIVMLLLLPDPVGAALLGDSWSAVHEVLPWVAGSYFFITVTTIATIGLKVLRRGRDLVVNRLVLAPAGISLGVLGAVMWQAEGAAIGMFITSIIASALWGVRFFRARTLHVTPRPEGV
jgi:O-antigen/teichoic acid export membrane protein